LFTGDVLHSNRKESLWVQREELHLTNLPVIWGIVQEGGLDGDDDAGGSLHFTEDSKKVGWLSEIHIDKLWASPELSEQTRGAIWQYMQTLYILGTTITMFPPETLSMIENVAEKCAENMQESGTFDMSAMSSLFSSLMANGGTVSPLALGGSGGRPPVAPGAPKKKKPKKNVKMMRGAVEEEEAEEEEEEEEEEGATACV
jgi:hypothetical protein